MQTYEEKVQKEDHGDGDVQRLGDGGGVHLGRHHPHLAGGGPVAEGAEGQLESGWDRCSYGLCARLFAEWVTWLPTSAP